MAEMTSFISPAITRRPVEVIIWVLTGLSPAQKSNALDEIRSALQTWEDVETSHLKFTVKEIIEQDERPDIEDHQLLLKCGPADKITSGSAQFPYGGNPGEWYGVAADNDRVNIKKTAVHEIGHTIGLHHSTISEYFEKEYRPVMHYNKEHSENYPTMDDKIGLSLLYPDPDEPLNSVGGTIRGRLVMKSSGVPVSGVNIVAVDVYNGSPVYAHFSGPRTSQMNIQDEGEFILSGLPPSKYKLKILDGNSYHGGMTGIRNIAEGENYNRLRKGYQADNFDEFEIGNYNIETGDFRDLGDINIDIKNMSIDKMFHGVFPEKYNSFVPANIELPNAKLNEPYEHWLHISGGLRNISVTSKGKPLGIKVEIAGDQRVKNVGIHGAHYVRIHGTPEYSGFHTIEIKLTDSAGKFKYFHFNLAIEPLPAKELVAEYHFNRDGHDYSNNNRHAICFGRFTENHKGEARKALKLFGINDMAFPIFEKGFDLKDFTIAVILKLDKLRDKKEFIFSKGYRYGNYSVYREEKGERYAGYAMIGRQKHNTTVTWRRKISNSPLPENEFFSLILRLEDDILKSYINGELEKTIRNVPPPRFNDYTFMMGAGGITGLSGFMKGIIDDVWVYNYALGETEIEQLGKL